MRIYFILLIITTTIFTTNIYQAKYHSQKYSSNKYSRKYSSKKKRLRKTKHHRYLQKKPSITNPQKQKIVKQSTLSKSLKSLTDQNIMHIEPIILGSLANQSPKLSGPIQKGGIIDMRPGDDYLTKSTLDFDTSSIETITQNNLIGKYKNAVILDIAPRRMWGWGGDFTGYCGETDFQMCGLYFGNWVSSELVRYAAKNEQLLLGVNDVKTAKTLKYNYDVYDGEDIDDFIVWVKKHIDQGAPVLLGFYQYHKPNEDADDDYDHIMPIIGYSLDPNKQVNGFYFYDLYLKNYSLMQSANFNEFKKNYFKTRKQTHLLKSYKLPDINNTTKENSPNLPDFAVGKNNQIGYEICAYTYAIPKDVQYSIAITGIENKKNEKLFRTKLIVNQWNEPDWGAEDKKNEAPINLKFSAIIYGLTPGKIYTILQFQPEINTTKHTINTHTIPTSNYAKANYTQKISFTAQNSIEKIELGSLKSDGAYFYRTIEGNV